MKNNIKHIIKNIVQESVNNLLLENRESKNINLARKYLKNNGYDDSQAQKILDNIRTDIPNTRLGQCKFLLGACRFYINNELNNAEIINSLNRTLPYIATEAHIDEYDNNLNNLSLNDIVDRFKGFAQQDLALDKENLYKQTFKPNTNYSIVEINSFDEAEYYSDYTSWCITHDKNAYNNYTNNGLNRFYFCLMDDFEYIPREKGENCPLDEYGLSMIAVSVNPDGSLKTSTCRWNHDMEGNDNILNTKQISELIGYNFYDVFKPISQEELEEIKNKIANRNNIVLKKANELLNNISFDNEDSFDDIDLLPLLEEYYPFVDRYTDSIFLIGENIEDDLMIALCYNQKERKYNFITEQDGTIFKFHTIKVFSINPYLMNITNEDNKESYLLLDNEGAIFKTNNKPSQAITMDFVGNKIAIHYNEGWCLFFKKNASLYPSNENPHFYAEVIKDNDSYYVQDFNSQEKIDVNQLLNSLHENKEYEVSANDINLNNVQKRASLAPKIWNNNQLNPKVRMKLLDIADSFWLDLNLNWVDISDIIITGSICNYNWSKFSDIDLHILIDYKQVDDNINLVKDFFYVKKNEWNENHMNLTIYGYPIEIYVQDINEPHNSTGIFSLEKNKWLKKPDYYKLSSIHNPKDIKEKSAMLMTIVDNIEDKLEINKNNPAELRILKQKINAFCNKLIKMRHSALYKGGEMSDGNIIYKLLRQNGYVDKIYKLKYTCFDYLNSI